MTTNTSLPQNSDRFNPLPAPRHHGAPSQPVNRYHAAALFFHALGFNVSAVEQATKKPAHAWKKWHSTRQSKDDVQSLTWSDYWHKKEQRQVHIGGVGFFAGVGFYRNFDFDKCPGEGPMLAALVALGLPSDYPWVIRTGSGNGWHIIVKCYDDIAPGQLELKDKETGVYTAKSRAGDFDHLELRWKECHNVLPPSAHESGGRYQFRNGTMPTIEPAVVTVDRVVTAFRSLTVEPEPVNTAEQEPEHADSDSSDLTELATKIRERLDLATFAAKEKSAEIKKNGDEERILGENGLLIKGRVWNWFGDGTGRTGGGALELINWLRFDDATPPRGKRFIEVLEIGAAELGLPMPEREKPKAQAQTTKPAVMPTPAPACHVTALSDLLKKQFAPVRWVVPGLLTEGLSILAGPPKMGKSWLCLALALAVGNGGYALGKIKTDAGDVLYLALEDNERRLQNRAAMVLGHNDAAPDCMDVATSWARVNEGGADQIEEWLKAHPRARLVVIDTLKQIRPPQRGNANAYEQDYDAVQPLKRLADQYHVAIIVVHHTRKMESDDPLEMISGTFGLSGGVDGAMILKRKRGEADAVLYATGRDMDEKELAIKWDGPNTIWWLMGDAEQYAISKERQEIISLLQGDPGMSPKDIAEALGKQNSGAVRKLLGDMVRDGQIKSTERGRYYAKENSNNGSLSNNSNIGNNGNNDEWTLPE